MPDKSNADVNQVSRERTTTKADKSDQQRLERGDIPFTVGNHVEWLTRRQIVRKMRDDFEDRHVCTVSENDPDDE